MSNEIIPATGKDVVPATDTDVALVTGTDVLVVDAGGKEDPRLEAPKEKPFEPRTVDQSRMRPGDARRLVNRLRRYRFYLFVRIPMYDTQYKGEFKGVTSSELLPIGQQDLIAFIKRLEEMRPDRWMHIILNHDSRYLAVG